MGEKLIQIIDEPDITVTLEKEFNINEILPGFDMVIKGNIIDKRRKEGFKKIRVQFIR